jgi:hypothetical protein
MKEYTPVASSYGISGGKSIDGSEGISAQIHSTTISLLKVTERKQV